MSPDPERTRPLVSVVVPVYNAARHLQASLDSIVAQTYPNLEVVVADDASTDGSKEIAESYGDPVRVVRRKKNLGQFPNVEDAVGRARGELVCVFHADDVYHPEIVEREVEYLQRHQAVGTVLTMDMSMDAEGRVYGKIDLPAHIESGHPMDYREVLRWLMIHKNTFLRTPSAMVRAPLFDQVGSFRDEEFGYAADLDMWIRLARLQPVAVLGEHLFSYRHTPDSVAHSYKRERRELDVFFQIVETHLQETGYEPPDEAWAAFRAYREEERLLVATGDYVRDDMASMRKRLAEVRLGDLVGSGRVRRPRLLVLYGLLRLLSGLPRLSFVSEIFRNRWWSGSAQSPPSELSS